MSKVTITLAAFPVALVCAAVTASDLQDVGLKSASDTLHAALDEAYPDVTQWTITPVLTDRARRELPSAVPDSTSVIRLGARSAVHLMWKQPKSSYTYTLWYDVSGLASVVVANRDLPVGASTSPADAVVAERDVMREKCQNAKLPEELNGMRMRRALRADAPICRDALEIRPSVARGEAVAVQFVSPRIAITGTAVALADARIGQSVRVMNPTSREVFRAVVSAAQEVTVRQ
ncbi:MAG TPA: flagellar basal body P-ring formation chaperone FlgA [Steroidobacteraceae bacterium]|nr:flagellar basal body P-ring formation chaperone FlgA [Steroidobacteraceae bacterium]